MKNDIFDKQVREKLSEHEAPVPADTWDNIQKGKRRRRPFPFFWFLAACIICGSIVIVTYEQKKPGTGIDKTTASENPESNPIITSSTTNGQDNKPGNNAGEKAGQTPEPPSTTDTEAGKRRIQNDIYFNNAQINSRQNNMSLAQSSKPGTGQDEKFNRRKNKRNSSSKTAVSITPADPSADNPAENSIPGNDSQEIASIVADKKTGSTAVINITTDSIQKMIAITDTLHLKKENKKKNKTGFTIHLSGAGFTTFGNSGRIVSLTRTTQTNLHKAEFTASEKSIRIQPGISFNISLEKSFTPKWSVEAGIGYASVKEYIHLRGEEINTHYSIVKRLQNGNALINDTIATVTRGNRMIDAVNSYQFVSLPVNIHYNILHRNNWSLSLAAGIDVNLESRYRNSINGEPGISLSSANTKRNTSIGTGFNMQARLARNFFNKASAFISPYAQFNPTKLYTGEMLVPRSINRAGLMFGFSYGL